MGNLKEVFEEELIYGARRQASMWKGIAAATSIFGAIGCLSAVFVAFSVDKPPPVLVPFDPSTGTALPMANVGTISLNEREAVMQSLVYAYVRDRETYHPMDNDQRIERVFARSSGAAARSLQQQWNETNPNYPPKVYGSEARIDVAVSSVADIGNNRAQARVRKRLTTPDGTTEGTFIVTLAYAYDPSTLRDLDGVWANPFGFTVSEYSVAAERFRSEGDAGPQSDMPAEGQPE